MKQNIQVFQKNEVIFREGDYQKWMYDIAKGSVEIYANFGKENQVLLTTLTEGQYFGEIGLADLIPRTASAVAAQDDTQLSVIDEGNFCEYFHGNPEALLSIMSNMSARVRSLTSDYMNACQAIYEAANAAKNGKEKSSSLNAKLAKLMQDAAKPSFVMAGIVSDAKAFLTGTRSKDDAIKTFRKNEVIFNEGDSSDCMYDIHWGKVGIYVNYGKENEKLLVELGSEQFFGEMGMIDNLPRSATAVSLENNTKVQRIAAEDFPQYMQEKPAKVVMMMQHLGNRLRKLTENYMKACRAASEAENSEASGDKKGWSKESLQRFLEDYNEGMRHVSDYDGCIFSGYIPYYHL